VSGSAAIVQLNLAFDPLLASPLQLLTTYHTLTGWSGAIVRAGADVTTVQRFSADAELTRPDGRFVFVDDGPAAIPDAWDVCDRVVDTVAGARPDLVHVNGLMFPGMTDALRRSLPGSCAIVLQDHSGILPRTWPWPLDGPRSARWERAFRQIDACAFTARELACRWHPVGLPADVPILEISPAGTSLVPIDAAEARRMTGMTATTNILWVGRLDDNKDPLTALAGLERALPSLSAARCWMIYGDRPLERQVRERVAASDRLREAVSFVGDVPHDAIAAWFSGADIFISGSHHEGSGYSLIEAMACGVVPCVTDIPSFRALTGGHGRLWTPGDGDACAQALLDLAGRDHNTQRVAIRERYERALSWDAIGMRTVREYTGLIEARVDRAARS